MFATVGNKAITHSDIVNEIKMITILSNQIFSEETRQMLQTTAIQSVIKRNIKQIEIEKYNLEYSIIDLKNELNKVADNAGMDVDTLKQTFTVNGLIVSDIENHLKTELLWNSLIFQLYKNRLSINIDEIDEQLQLIQNKKKINEYLLAEIIIKPTTKDKLEAEIKAIKNKIKTDGFEKVATNLSISETSLKGGNLGWLSENVIAERIKSQIIKTPVGSVSEAIILPEGILFLKLKTKEK